MLVEALEDGVEDEASSPDEHAASARVAAASVVTTRMPRFAGLCMVSTFPPPAVASRLLGSTISRSGR